MPIFVNAQHKVLLFHILCSYLLDLSRVFSSGVLRLRYDPLSSKRMARLDFQMGSHVQGFTFNIGDSPTNNGYGGDGGTTSNSAEIHSNDNRFYVKENNNEKLIRLFEF